MEVKRLEILITEISKTLNDSNPVGCFSLLSKQKL